MSPFLIETIKCIDGKCCNLSYHQHRFNFTRKQLFPGAEPILLNDAIQVPAFAQKGLFRCRVLYSSGVENIEFLPHRIRPVKSLKIVIDNAIDYSYKSANRQELEALFAQRGSADDILIVKNNCIGDSFTANLVFWDGQHWWTSDTPLLPGTQRAKLISENKIKVRRIQVNDLNNFYKAGLINAMQDLENMPVFDINQIK